MTSRELHEHILRRVEHRLNGRSWAWLSRETGIPRSTLVTQAGHPKFSVEVLVKVASALERDPGFFLPPARTPSRTEAIASRLAMVIARELEDDIG